MMSGRVSSRGPRTTKLENRKDVQLQNIFRVDTTITAVVLYAITNPFYYIYLQILQFFFT